MQSLTKMLTVFLPCAANMVSIICAMSELARLPPACRKVSGFMSLMKLFTDPS